MPGIHRKPNFRVFQPLYYCAGLGEDVSVNGCLSPERACRLPAGLTDQRAGRDSRATCLARQGCIFGRLWLSMSIKWRSRLVLPAMLLLMFQPAAAHAA